MKKDPISYLVEGPFGPLILILGVFLVLHIAAQDETRAKQREAARALLQETTQ